MLIDDTQGVHRVSLQLYIFISETDYEIFYPHLFILIGVY